MNVELTNGFRNSMIAGIVIQIAVLLKNSTEQSKEFPLKMIGGIPAKVLFALGWLAFALSVAKEGNDKKGMIALIGALSIVVGVFYVKFQMKSGKTPNPMIAMLFPIGWLITALGIWYNNKGPLKNLSWVGTGMILVSMMKILPWQRKHGVVGGGGYNLFTMAWVLLALANGVKRIN